MLFRFTKLFIAVGLVVAWWALTIARRDDHRSWVRLVAAHPEHVRILQFYASVGVLAPGQTALLCYGVENAKSVKISPNVPGIYPSPNRCVQIVPKHTTHYTILAEGFDGRVEAKSFTLPVAATPPRPLPSAPRYIEIELPQP
jgi:hypothetical protein